MDNDKIIAVLVAAHPLAAKLARIGINGPLTAEDQQILNEILAAGLVLQRRFVPGWIIW